MLESEFGIVKQSLDMDEIIRSSVESLKDDKVIEQCRAARKRFLADKIDVTEHIVKVLEETAQQGAPEAARSRHQAGRRAA